MENLFEMKMFRFTADTVFHAETLDDAFLMLSRHFAALAMCEVPIDTGLQHIGSLNVAQLVDPKTK